MSDPSVSPSLQVQLHPLINRLAEQILHIWQEELELSAYVLPDDLGYVEGRLEGERLIIENRCFQSQEFRKMHLELARAGSNLDILHCVMFPHLTYPLPMFGCDIVAGRGQISAAIVDLSPVESQLPQGHQQALESLRSLTQSFSEKRELPEWGSIFSPYCLFIRPADDAEADQFLRLASHYLRIHCQQARQMDGSGDPKLSYAGQHRYCTQQQQNDRTRRVLEKAFGPAWAERYMTTVLFDLPPSPL
ncbi:MAG: phycocyanobilin:ferredoxin oxidoreductase [Cyanobacteriota bacterium]|nr:phycocyanobilin:ferredoxin oxidoreductase [Cyanobacteriota bacterium]